MEEYFSGKKLYGDDFDEEQIRQWYEDEKEGYANLVSEQKGEIKAREDYGYHHLNTLHGYRFLPENVGFEKVLGLGAAFGHEFLPIISRIKEIHIVEPSDHLIAEKLEGVSLKYQKPTASGKMAFPSDYFQLETCFGTLHHIPNVSFVLNELHRCLAPGGYLLIREPINSMGDWRQPRHGLTKRERGIPMAVLRKNIKTLGFHVVNESFCFAMTSFLERKVGKWLERPLHDYKTYLYFDRIISQLTAFNLKYHPQTPLQRIAPSSVFYVLQKR